MCLRAPGPAAAAGRKVLASEAALVHFAEDRGQAVFAESQTVELAAARKALAVLGFAVHTEVGLAGLVHTLRMRRTDQE